MYPNPNAPHNTGDTSGQSEPLLSSFDEPPTTVSIIAQPAAGAANTHHHHQISGTAAVHNSSHSSSGTNSSHSNSLSGSSNASRTGSNASTHQVLIGTNNGSITAAASASAVQTNEHNPITPTLPGSTMLIHYDEVSYFAIQASTCQRNIVLSVWPGSLLLVIFWFNLSAFAPSPSAIFHYKIKCIFAFKAQTISFREQHFILCRMARVRFDSIWFNHIHWRTAQCMLSSSSMRDMQRGIRPTHVPQSISAFTVDATSLNVLLETRARRLSAPVRIRWSSFVSVAAAAVGPYSTLPHTPQTSVADCLDPINVTDFI